MVKMKDSLINQKLSIVPQPGTVPDRSQTMKHSAKNKFDLSGSEKEMPIRNTNKAPQKLLLAQEEENPFERALPEGQKGDLGTIEPNSQ